jgi:uncharacterized glyoxalase superfamily protein PhnB
MAEVKPIPDGMHTVTPHLVCKDAAKAIEFYEKAFGAETVMRMDMPGGGKLMHACLRFGDSAVMLADEFPDWNSLGPSSRGGTTVVLHIYVPDADAFFEKAIKAGAEVVMPLGDAFWGDRYGQLKDPFGHIWSVATHVKDLTPEEIAEAAKTAMNEGCGDK